jgi:hypothetical protein
MTRKLIYVKKGVINVTASGTSDLTCRRYRNILCTRYRDIVQTNDSTAMCEPVVTLESSNDKTEVNTLRVFGSSPEIIIRRRSLH